MLLAVVLLLAGGARAIVPSGYSVTHKMDCGYPVCQTTPARVGGACGLYGSVPCNITAIALA